MSRLVGSTFDFGNSAKIINLPNPVDSSDAATKGYVDSAVEGLAWKDNVRVSTSSNVNLAAPGATLDGVTMALGDRFLARGQSTDSQNGIYIWNGASTPATRSPDASTYDELESAVVTVDEGTSAGTTYRQSGLNGTIGVSDVTWTTFGTTTPLANETTPGSIKVATQPQTDAGAVDDAAVTPLKLANWSGRVRRFSQTFGDGSATQFTITHNLGTQDVVVGVRRNSGAFDEVLCDVEHTTTNSITLRFVSAPASNAFRVSIVG